MDIIEFDLTKKVTRLEAQNLRLDHWPLDTYFMLLSSVNKILTL